MMLLLKPEGRHALDERAARPFRTPELFDRAEVERIADMFDGTSFGNAALAWLRTYDNAVWLGFEDATARRQAAFAWDLGESAPRLAFD